MPKKQLQGKIVSLSAAQTVKVKIERQWQHPLYKKSVKRSKNYICDSRGIELKLDDEVVIEECQPISKTKRFRVIKQVSK